jgi:tRNA pseudouridine55 synthase
MSRKHSSKRDVNGILLLDKPLNMSSNAALQVVKTLFNARKAGHTGSLDPLATGMLPLCFGEATKFSQFLLDADKCYQVIGRLGEKTTTADSEGEVIQRVDEVAIEQQQLEQALSLFKGEIEQVPSMYSAIKHKGTPLYKLARQGIEVERKPRRISIHELELLNFDGRDFELKVVCSKGTYIRNLIEDIGDHLQVGAHVIKLHRLYTFPYQGVQMCSLEQLKELADAGPKQLDELILPVETAVSLWPVVNLDPAMTFHIRNGQAIRWHQPEGSEWVRLCDTDNNFIGVGEVTDDGRIAPKRLLKKVS